MAYLTAATMIIWLAAFALILGISVRLGRIEHAIAALREALPE